MTSTAAVQREIERFLRSQEPEVLCITGEWGVGKTYNWQIMLDQLRTSGRIALGRYSYVSLFGINSLEAFKNSIFENMEFILPDGEAAFDRMLTKGNQLFQQGKKVFGALSAVPKVGEAVVKVASPFLFSSIRNQIVCVDDLERRGDGLAVKDVFGLISFLREQRGCKVVLLLNEAKLEGVAACQFRDYFEKTVDTRAVFSPTAAEAANIAFGDGGHLATLIPEYSVKLGVKNIRVLKKIERLIKIVLEVLSQPSEKLERQVVHSLVLFGWSKFDSGRTPPTLEYLKNVDLMTVPHDAKPTPEEQRWDTIRASYEFGRMDDFDLALANFVESGILNDEEIRAEAEKQEARFKQQEQASSFSDAFRLLHDSFTENHQEVCLAVVKGFEENLNVISLSDLNQVVEILHRIGEPRLAEHVINYAEQNATGSFWLQDDPFNRPLYGEKLNAVVTARKVQATPERDFETDLVSAAETYNAETVARVAAHPSSDFLGLFEAKSGPDLRRVVLSALEFRKIANASPDMLKIIKTAEEALATIGQRSALNAFRVRNYGVIISSGRTTEE